MGIKDEDTEVSTTGESTLLEAQGVQVHITLGSELPSGDGRKGGKFTSDCWAESEGQELVWLLIGGLLVVILGVAILVIAWAQIKGELWV